MNAADDHTADDHTSGEGRPRLGGRRRTVARLAAVQALYQLELNPELDAQAVVDNFYAWLNPETINPTVQTYIGEYFKSAKAINPTTVQLTLSKPYAPLLPVISQGYFGILSPSTRSGSRK